MQLAARFVPAADDVGRLQRGKETDGRLFQEFAEQGHYGGRTRPSTTRQGIYAVTPSGKLLASINSRDARAVAGMLESALARWDELPRAERLRSEAAGPEPKRWEALFPGDGLALHVVVRDLERERLPDDWRAHAWNQDHAWFTRAEALALVPAERVAGAEQAWPAELASRLVRCHLLDGVRGQVLPFPAKAVERAELSSRVSGVAEGRVELELAGRTRAVARGTWPVDDFRDHEAPREQERGFESELAGRATYDLGTQRFTRFELVAVGTRWGGTQFNCRGDDLEPAPIGVSLTLAGSTPAECVAPAQIREYGWTPP